jgi:hypothetical protein
VRPHISIDILIRFQSVLLLQFKTVFRLLTFLEAESQKAKN